MKTNHNYLRYILSTIILIIFGCEDKITKWDLIVNITPDSSGKVIQSENDVVLNGSYKYEDNTELTITAIPEIGWTFDHWEGDLTGSANPTTIVMDGDKSVTAVFVKLQYPLSITISGEGEVTEEIVVAKTTDYDHGSNIQLTAIPETGWTFDHWEGDLTGSDNPAVIVMDGDKSVTAVFTQIPYNINLTITGNGTVTKIPDQTMYFYNTTVQLTATPETGWVFDQWTGDLTGSTNPINLIIESTITAVAIFVQLHTLTTSIDGNGTISLNPNSATYKHNSQVQLTANADQGWTFDHWEGDLSGSENPTTITMDGDKSVTAVFTQDQYILSITTNGSGTVASNPNQASYLYNQDVILTATPSANWLFSSWGGDLTGSSNPKTIQIKKNSSVTANFVKITDGLSASLGACVIMFNFVYEICASLTNELPVGITVNRLEFFNGSGDWVNGTGQPGHLNNNWIPANSEIRVGLSFQIPQLPSYFSGWRSDWYCSYNGIDFVIVGYYGVGKVSANQINLPLVSYSVIEEE